MKKINAASLGIFSFSLLTLGVGPAFASEEQPVAKTEATILFKADDETGPGTVTPPGEDGDKDGSGEVDPGGSDGNSGDGNKSFNITWVSNFRFNKTNSDGSFEPILLNGNGMQLWAKGTKLTLNMVDEDGQLTGEKKVYQNIPNFVQVTDNRGTANGWHLTVSRTEFEGTDEEGAKQTLAGAELTLNDQHIYGPEGVAAPQGNEGKVVKIGQDNESVLTAAKGAGTGTWSLNFGDANKEDGTLVDKTGVKLLIPASAQPKANVEYKSELTWTLTDGPSA